jgi:hypothetical protein
MPSLRTPVYFNLSPKTLKKTWKFNSKIKQISIPQTASAFILTFAERKNTICRWQHSVNQRQRSVFLHHVFHGGWGVRWTLAPKVELIVQGRVARFFGVQRTKMVKNVHNIYQSFSFQGFPNYTKLGFLVWKYTIWQPWSRVYLYI